MAGPYITIDNIVTFSANDLLIPKEGREASVTDPERLLEAIRLATSHMSDERLIDACCGGRGPLEKYSSLTFEEYLDVLAEIEAKELEAALALVRERAERRPARQAKDDAMRARRSEFAKKRPQLVLKMLAAGVPFKCSHPDCTTGSALTLDHIEPLSKGGSDDLSNLQFMCIPHNSAKGDRTP